MVAQRVLVAGKRDLPGLLYPGLKPPHLTPPADREKAPKITDFFVDVGLPEEEVRELVPIGSMVARFRDEFEAHMEQRALGVGVVGKLPQPDELLNATYISERSGVGDAA